MSFIPQFNVSDLMKGVDSEIRKMEQYIQNELEYVGLNFVKTARVKADFTDRTGNLRSSIGYMILKNGKIVSDNFETSQQGTDKETGRQKAFEFALENVESNIGFMLIVVAGMEYAVFVEAKGYDVITGSSLKADKDLQEVFSKLQSLR